jgi:hypothetical protein
MIKNQINEIVSEEDLEGLERVKFTVCGGEGHSKDDTEILKMTVLQPIGDGLCKDIPGKRFIIQKLSEGELSYL